jgi:hypothetical protein
MILVTQIVSVLVAIICIGQAIKNGSTKFDKITFSVFCFIFLALCIGLQVVHQCCL